MKGIQGEIRRQRPALILALLVLSLGLAARAEAFVYWPHFPFSGSGGPALGRANPDGTGTDKRFLELPPTIIEGGSETIEGATAVAVDAAHVYWISSSGGIGRANLNGTHARQRFIRLRGHRDVCDVAVDAAHVYWTSSDGDTGSGVIGRANLDGSGVDQGFIPGASDCSRIAVDAAHVYWTFEDETGSGAIGRANLDGTSVDQSFIPLEGAPCGVAVDAAHLYWGGGTGIGRANLDGTDATESFIPRGRKYPCDLAVDGASIYWVNYDGDTDSTIGRTNLDGSGVDHSFIPDPGDFLFDVAVDGLRSFSFGKVKSNRSKGTAKLTVTVPGPGQLKLVRTKTVASATKFADAAGRVRLPITPRGSARNTLEQSGETEVKARVTYTPVSGDPSIVASTYSTTLELIKEQRHGRFRH
jgi:virginiamycin B lyase